MLRNCFMQIMAKNWSEIFKNMSLFYKKNLKIYDPLAQCLDWPGLNAKKTKIFSNLKEGYFYFGLLCECS